MAGSFPALLPHAETADVRTRLLKAAQEQILATGFFEASVDQIARRAGASKQTIYAHFASKEQLFREVLGLTMAEASEAGAPDVTSLPLDAAVQTYAAWIADSALAPDNRELYRANIAAATAFPELAADLHRLRTDSAAVSVFLARHPGNDRLPPLAPERLANWLGVLAMGGARQLLGFAQTPAERQARMDGIVQAFTGGWRLPVAPTPCMLATPLPPPAPLATLTEGSGRLSSARWQDLLRIAAQSFSRTGLRRTSVEEIGAAAGISKMTVYKRFGSKQGLFAAAIEQAVDDLLASRRALAFDGDGDIRPALEALALAQDRLNHRSAQVRLLRLLITEAPTQPGPVQHAWNRLMAPAREELAAQLRAWQAARRLHVTDAGIAAEQFLLIATRGNRRLTDTLAWDEDEARTHARDAVALFYR